MAARLAPTPLRVPADDALDRELRRMAVIARLEASRRRSGRSSRHAVRSPVVVAHDAA